MCGLCGVAFDDLTRRPDPERVRAMTRTLALRGPDDEGVWTRGPLAVGFRRLSIIDLSGGHQPIENEDGTIALAINCEIYNFVELRAELEAKGHRFRTRCDSEVVLHLYEEHGERCAERLVGMYAFCLLDLRDPLRPKVVLGRDRLGIKPMFYARTHEGLLWASEPKALLEWGTTPRELRPEKLLDYLVLGYTGGEESAWSGIRRLPPASTLSWRPGTEPVVHTHWDLPTASLAAPTSDEEVLDWLDRTVKEELAADVPLGAFLSGGIDSTAVVTSMARARSQPVVACSVGFHDKQYDELDLARNTARRLGAVHHTEILEPDPKLATEVLPWIFDEPLADPSTLPTYLVARMARRHVTVALCGDGGDETFAGYRRYIHDVAENRVRRALGAPGRALAGAFGRVYPKADWAPQWMRGKTFLENMARHPADAYFHSVTQLARIDALALLAPDLGARLLRHDPAAEFRRWYERVTIDDPLYRVQYADFHTYLPDQILAKADRASMGASLEVRPPLLDHRFVERFAPLPAGQKVRGGRGKHALRLALRSRVPSEILDGRKRGFDTPLRAWIAGPLGKSIEDAIHTLPNEWFAKDILRARLAEHRSGLRDHGRVLWSLLVLEHWRRRHAVRGLSA
ncbi:MAG: asparagine synthase (glutamine-hydrolyzing) [Planctomycetes bacterium]|nr:asparagine synthase (glutamine-hydrolyzing) [Planctomycetota bacterium]